MGGPCGAASVAKNKTFVLPVSYIWLGSLGAMALALVLLFEHPILTVAAHMPLLSVGIQPLTPEWGAGSVY
jgi:hypothetical protein